MAKTTSRTVTRTDRVKGSPRSTRTTEVDVVETNTGGLGLEGGVAIVTAILLIAAFLMIDHELGAAGSGLFFKR